MEYNSPVKIGFHLEQIATEFIYKFRKYYQMPSITLTVILNNIVVKNVLIVSSYRLCCLPIPLCSVGFFYGWQILIVPLL